MTCNKYIHFTKAKVRSILTGNAKEKKYCLVWWIAQFWYINHSILGAADVFWTLLRAVTEGPWISKHVIESLKIYAALYMSPCVNHLQTPNWFSSCHNRVHQPRVYSRTRCLYASACVCVCFPLQQFGRRFRNASGWSRQWDHSFFFLK